MIFHLIFYIINYIISYTRKSKETTSSVVKIVRVPENKSNPKKINLKFTNSASNYCNKHRIY